MRRHARLMVCADIPQCVAIDCGDYLDKWTEQDFRRAMDKSNCVLRVIEIGNLIVGYIVYDLHQSLKMIQRLAVHRSFRRQYVGRQMIEDLKRISTQRPLLIADLHERNVDAQVFFRACGFAYVRTIPEVAGEDDVYRLAFDMAEVQCAS